MSHPRIEEVSDSDSDPEIDDPSDFAPNEYMRPASPTDHNHHSGLRTSLTPSNLPPRAPDASNFAKPPIPTPTPQIFQAPAPTPQSDELNNAKRAEIKPYVSIYPVYFSARRTRATGRRVAKNLAVQDPLAFNILKATRAVLGVNAQLAFEPDKTHPQDWSNPGRVKVKMFDTATHAPLHTIRCKRKLLAEIARILQENPTQKSDPLELRLNGLNVPENFLETDVAVPRGWKMGGILPVHSAAVSGGGVSDNFFKEAMEEMKMMQGANGGGGGGMPDMSALAGMMGNMGMGGGGGQPSIAAPKKEKKKK